MNITLIGMPGVGKSSIGKELAFRLQFNFLDVDNIIEKNAELNLREIIDKYGEEKFLEMEQKTVIGLGEIDCCVICPGGSVVYSQEAMSFLKDNSTIVFLDAELECIKERITDLNGRGIIGLNGKDLADVYRQRHHLYEKYADVILKISRELNIPEHVNNIVRFVSFS